MPESQRFLQAALDALSAHIAVLDTDGTIRAVNAAWRRFAEANGFRGARFGVGSNYLDVCEEVGHGGSCDDSRAAADGIRAVASGLRERFVMDYPCHGPDEQRWFQLTVTRFAEASPARLVVAHEDVTARKLAELALRDSEHKLRLALEAAGLAIWEWRKDGTRILSDNYAQVVGAAPLSNETFLDLVHPADRSDLLRCLQVALRETGVYRCEYRVLPPDGPERWIAGYGRVIFDDADEPDHMIGIVMDVTTRRRDEKQREELLRVAEQARVEAESASRAKDDFLATLSHELRSPLQAAVGWVTLLRAGSLSPEQQTKAVTTLERSVRHQVQLVNDLLDVSRILTGKLFIETSLVDLGLVVEQVREEFQVEARNRGIELTLDSSLDCGSVNGDLARLGQIFRNLIANALKFTPTGGRVTMGCARDADRVVVSVADTGQGIASDFLPHVFDRFSQADTTITRQHGGLGLGLGIVRHLVELHGGSVEAHSDGIGRGATFRVSLPVAVTPVWTAGAGVPAALPAVGADAATSLDGVHVLVVEDEMPTRDALALALQQAGARVTVTAGAREALALMTVTSPDVVVTDLGMPGEDGFWLAQRVREARLAIPMVALTGFADVETRARVERAGMQAHVTKPVDLPLLLATLRALGRGRAVRARPSP